MFALPGHTGGLIERLESRQLLSDTPLREAMAVESSLPPSPSGDASESGPPPQVRDVHIGASAWSSEFFNDLERGRLGTAPYGRWINTTYSTIHPWVNVNQVTIRLTHDMAVEAHDLRIRGVAQSSYDVASVETVFTFPATTTATFTIAGPGFVQADNLLIEVNGDPGGVHVRGGETLLDGDRDGVPGGDFVFRMSIVPGDVTGGGNVGHTDLRSVRKALGRTATNPGTTVPFYTPVADLDGDGRVNVTDLMHVRRRLFTYAPTGTPAPAAPAGVTADLRARPAARSLFSSTAVLDA